MKNTMKTRLYLVITLVVLCLATACTDKKTPTSGGTDPSSTGKPASPTEALEEPTKPTQQEPQSTPANSLTPTVTSTPTPTVPPFDLEEIITDLTNSYPDASLQKLTDKLMENPYFRLFRKNDLSFAWTGLDFPYEKTPEGVEEAASIIDYISMSGVVYIIKPKDGADKNSIIDLFEKKADPKQVDYEKGLDNIFCKEINGKIVFAMYKDDMQPLTGTIAQKPSELISLFHEYLEEHKDAKCIDITNYMLGHQSMGELYTVEIKEGQVTGFITEADNTGISGFSDGALLSPMISPNNMICHVFKVKDAAKINEFIDQLDKKKNLSWQCCVTVDNSVAETEGDYVLFLMYTDY